MAIDPWRSLGLDLNAAAMLKKLVSSSLCNERRARLDKLWTGSMRPWPPPLAGRPVRRLLLALAITTLEVGSIISVMASGSPGVAIVARDTIYSVVMIVLDGIVGLCLVVGAECHYEQEFNLQGATATLGVITTLLAVISPIMPNFTLATPGPTWSTRPLLLVGTVAFSLCLLFVCVQTVRRRGQFVIRDTSVRYLHAPRVRSVVLASILMVVSLAVVIATVVLLPEGVTALKAARRSRLQTSLDASLGSALASIGLTVPIVGAASVLIGQPMTLGLDPDGMVPLVLTLSVSTLTFATGRTSILQGGLHLVILAVFVFLQAIP